jgi:Anti-sigma factor NepR
MKKFFVPAAGTFFCNLHYTGLDNTIFRYCAVCGLKNSRIATERRVIELERQAMGELKGGRRGATVKASTDGALDPVTAALRQMHDEIASEPIPEDFLALLDKIDAKMSATKKFS